MQIKGKTLCSADEIQVEFPDILQVMMQTEKIVTAPQSLPVYWLRFMEDYWRKVFEEWRVWIQHRLPDLGKVMDELHCALYYDPTSKDE